TTNGGKSSTMTGYKFDKVKELEGNSDYVVLDVRKSTEFVLDAIPGAVNIAHTRLHARRNEIPAGKKLIVHCQAGGRSAVAGAYLKRAGYDVVYIDDNFENYVTEPAATA